MKITVNTAIFRNAGEIPRSEAALYHLLNAMVYINCDYLRVNPSTPMLYKSGVRYEREDGSEEWRDIPKLLYFGVGDCEDLGCWRVAELRVRRREKGAKIYIRHHIDSVSGKPIYHVMVKRANGQLEDPSMVLGME